MALNHFRNEVLLLVVCLHPGVLAGAEGSQEAEAGRAQLHHLQAVLQHGLHKGRPLGWILHYTWK